MKIKVCGMREAENIEAIAALAIDYMGFIFYEPSSRFVGEDFEERLCRMLPNHIKKVGVFVGAEKEYVLEKAAKYQLDFAQLHGGETPEYCETIKKTGLKIIKVFSVGEKFNFEMLKFYKKYSDFFLFDTKGEKHGGNGITFDWKILEAYNSEVPVFLSGGISLDNLQDIHKLARINIHAVDVNSKFEIAPALKNIDKVDTLIQYFK